MTETTSAPAPARAVPTRRISFEEFGDVPRHFAGEGDLLSSHLTANLSSVFPDGEDFFVRSVRHYRDQITDPVLKKQVAGFIGQEAVHGREHRTFNERLSTLGYPTRFFEKMTEKGLALRTKLAPAKVNLATTAALEHVTATFAEVLLTDEATRDALGHHEVRNLFVWHALEESEHKAVAFDVYQAVGGSERMRIVTMKLIRWGFTGMLVFQMLVSLLGDRAAYSPRTLRRSWKTFRSNRLLSKETWEILKEYEREGFHPDDRDTDGLVETWRAELFGTEGTLNDKLAGNRAAA